MADGKVHLKVVTRDRYVYCPYQYRKVVASVCFIGQRAPMHDFCFRCPKGASFEQQYKGRTFNKAVVPTSAPPGSYVRFPVKVNAKKYGIEYTYAMLKHDGTVEMPFSETVIPGTWLSGRQHHGPFSEAELSDLAKKCAKTRDAMLRNGGEAKSGTGGKKMIGEEMKRLIADKKRRDAIPDGGTVIVDGKAMVKSRYFGMVSKEHARDVPKATQRKAFNTSAFDSKKKAKQEAMPVNPASLITKEAKKLFSGLKKRKGN